MFIYENAQVLKVHPPVCVTAGIYNTPQTKGTEKICFMNNFSIEIKKFDGILVLV